MLLLFLSILVLVTSASSRYLSEIDDDRRGFSDVAYPRMSQERAIKVLYSSRIDFESDNDFINELYVPSGDPPTKYFWSGFGVPGSAEIAAEIARYHNGVTLEMLLEQPENAHIKQQMCTWPPREDVSPVAEACRMQWKKLSRTYAEKSRGHAQPILGDYVSGTSVWITEEKKALQQSQQKGNYVYGFQNPLNLYQVYCIKMVNARTEYPDIKAKICEKA